MRELTLHAVERPDGAVGVSYKVVLANGLFFEADVTCVTVDGNVGWVGGVIRDSNAGIIVLGSTSMFYAIDNGEGGGGGRRGRRRADQPRGGTGLRVLPEPADHPRARAHGDERQRERALRS